MKSNKEKKVENEKQMKYEQYIIIKYFQKILE